jgi:hypothetical protein
LRAGTPVWTEGDCSIIIVGLIVSALGIRLSTLSIENGKTIPFSVKRVYYLYDIPGGVSRGGHAHKALQQFIVAVSGSFTVTLDDGKVKRSFTLNRPYQGLLLVPGIWRELDDFSSGSVCMVLASEVYDKDDYIHSYEEFVEYRRGE